MCHAHNREVQHHKSNPEYIPAWKKDKGSQHAHTHTHTYTHTHTHAHMHAYSVHTVGLQNKIILQGAERGLQYRQLVGQCTGLLCLMELLLTNQTTIKMVVQRQMHT